MISNPIVPETSTTLLRNVVDPQHERWTVLVARYEPMMRAYLHERFPSLEADEIVQTTFVELAKMLPRYVYAPDETGRFHNYLTGILRHKALRRVRELERETMLKESFAEERVAPPDDPEEEAYRQSLVEIALGRFFADETIAPRTKEIFRRLAVKDEAPEAVAQAFKVERHAVDQIKSRSLEKVRRFVAELEAADE